MTGISTAARAYGEQAAAKLLGNRAGHGGNKAAGVGYRQMRAADIVALAALAFDAGRKSTLPPGILARYPYRNESDRSRAMDLARAEAHRLRREGHDVNWAHNDDGRRSAYVVVRIL